MNQENLDSLKKTLLYTGFGTGLNEELENKIKLNVSDFVLNNKVSYNNDKDRVHFELRFRRGDQKEMYFFNNFKAQLQKENGDTRENLFYMNKGKNITAKEAYNLLDGRAVNKDLVNKDGEKYNVWVKLDFSGKREDGSVDRKMYNDNYGYRLEEAINKIHLKEMNDPNEAEKVIRSLKIGNLHAVTNQEGERLYIAAEPESGKGQKLHMYDKDMKEITTEVRNVTHLPQQHNDGGTKEQQQTVPGDDATNQKKTKDGQVDKQAKDQGDIASSTKKPKASKTSAKKQKDDGDLMPKNRQSSKKGLSI